MKAGTAFASHGHARRSPPRLLPPTLVAVDVADPPSRRPDLLVDAEVDVAVDVADLIVDVADSPSPVGALGSVLTSCQAPHSSLDTHELSRGAHFSC
jgi:hypothetical protein